MNERMRIVIACDGSEYADNAINDLPRAGLPREAEALIVNVQEKWLVPPAIKEVVQDFAGTSESAGAKTVRAKSEPEIESVEDENLLLNKATEKLTAFFPEWKIETFATHGSPSFQIIRKAREWNAGLIVVGSHGKDKNTIYSLGSVSQKIANEATCSVRVVRGNAWKKGAPTRILIGLDGTRAAQWAVEEVSQRMWMPGSEVRVVTAKDSAQNKQKFDKDAKKTDEWINSFVEKAERTLKSSTLSFSRIIEEGDPKKTIITIADEWGADCIFIGSCDTGNFYENILLGSVATAVVARAHCTVEVVRHKD